MADVFVDLAQRLRRMVKSEGRDAAPPVSRWEVKSTSPVRLVSDSGDVLEEGEEDFEVGAAADAELGDVVLVGVDDDGDYVGLAVLVAASGVSAAAKLKAAGAFVGQVVMSGLTTPDPGWLKCDGAGVTSAYPKLRAKLIADGSRNGVDGSGDPRVPNFARRMPIGPGGAIIVGSTGGAERVKLTAAESGRPSTTIAGTTGSMNRSNPHSHPADYNVAGTAGANQSNPASAFGGGGTVDTRPTDINHEHTFSGTAAAVDAAVDHENLSPYVGVLFVIYAGV